MLERTFCVWPLHFLKSSKLFANRGVHVYVGTWEEGNKIAQLLLIAVQIKFMRRELEMYNVYVATVGMVLLFCNTVWGR